MSSVREKLWAAIHRKRLAYIRTFCGDNGKVHVNGERVLADLKRFCGINRAGIVLSPVTRTVDSHATAYQAGLRDAFLRITKMLDLDPNNLEEETQHESQTPTDAG